MNNGEIIIDDEPRKVFLDERVRLIGIGLPKVVKLYLLLKESGINLGRTPLSPEEMYESLVEVLFHDRG